ncbi:type II secretion system F family protein [Candidatus Woesearchaeota archaeon]|nr:type II secretion system F family protein [Candidatus Woesearchaeota archaeon]
MKKTVEQRKEKGRRRPERQGALAKREGAAPVSGRRKGLRGLFSRPRPSGLSAASQRLDEQRRRVDAEAKRKLKRLEQLSDKQLVLRRQRQQKQQRRKLRNRQLLRKYLDKAGFEEADESVVSKNIFRIIIVACLVLSGGALIIASMGKPGVKDSIVFLTGLWTGIFAGLFVLAWVLLYIFLDIKIFKRTLEIEEVLPDFLQLASANISAGMPVDRALWFAVRPRFGILAKEIEDVAKSTVSGEDLRDALAKFTAKYDSVVLKRSINLLLEGMESGGEMAELLNKIALNIQETRILKKEMAANVMTYAIFIGFATVVAAPVLFGLAGQLLIIIQKIMGLMAAEGAGSGASTGMFSISLSGDSITLKDFRIFSVATLFVTSLFSSFIISIIRKGNVKEGAKYIPMFVLATLALYFLATWVLGFLLGGLLEL